LPFFVLCGVIYALSAMSHPPIPRFMAFSFGDKILHALAFMGVGMAAALGTILRRRTIDMRSYIEAWLLTAVYAVLDEVHQIFTPRRTPSSADWVADVLGAAFGILLFFAFALYCRRWLRRVRS
jgi:VanZ family protein